MSMKPRRYPIDVFEWRNGDLPVPHFTTPVAVHKWTEGREAGMEKMPYLQVTFYWGPAWDRRGEEAAISFLTTIGDVRSLMEEWTNEGLTVFFEVKPTNQYVWVPGEPGSRYQTRTNGYCITVILGIKFDPEENAKVVKVWTPALDRFIEY